MKKQTIQCDLDTIQYGRSFIKDTISYKHLGIAIKLMHFYIFTEADDKYNAYWNIKNRDLSRTTNDYHFNSICIPKKSLPLCLQQFSFSHKLILVIKMMHAWMYISIASNMSQLVL